LNQIIAIAPPLTTMSLTTNQIQIIKSTIPVLQQHGNEITTHFYSTLLREKPELNNIFNQANQANNHQAAALAGSLYAYASHIDDLGALSPAVERICHKHASLYIRPEHYDVVGEYLLRAMGDVLGAALTQEVLEAWGAAYWQLAGIMVKREGQMLRDAEGWTDYREFKIDKKVKESEEITSFYLKPVDGEELPGYLPGRYVSVMTTVPQLRYLQSRQYSLSDAPGKDCYRISVKREAGLSTKQEGAEAHPGYISNILHDEKKEGDVLSVSHPAGEFFLDPEKETTQPVVLISAGIGLTPMMAILNTLIQRRSQQRISWIHATRSTSAQAFGPYIRDVTKIHDNIKASIFITIPDAARDVEGVDYQYSGRMELDKLDRSEDLFLDNKSTQYYVCGPEGFMAAMEQSLRGMGVDDESIKMEVFGTGQIPKN